MDTLAPLALGAAVGAVVAWLLCRADAARSLAESRAELRALEAKSAVERESADRRATELQARIDEARHELAIERAECQALREENTRLRAGEATHATRLEELGRAHLQLREAFQALSADALRQNGEAFLQLARTELAKVATGAQTDLEKREKAIADLLAPIRDGLSRQDQKLAEIERQRAESFGALAQRLDLVATASETLRSETQNLVKALRAPAVRGRWGEVQLRRVVELAGMVEHCDFTTQESVDTEHGKLRPDMTIRLPNGKTIVVDSKAPLMAYLEATETQDDGRRRELLGQHAKQIRAHVDGLSRKNYWDQFDGASPEFVVLFLPGEVFFSAALEHDPALIEQSVDQRVILATPTTLIALLKAVAWGWRQETITRNALDVARLGKEIYERLGVLAGHFDDVGKGLTRAVSSYNKAVGSFESRVLVTARKFDGLGVQAPDDLAELMPIEQSVRDIQAQELRILPPPGGGVPVA